jgi:branched-chain amino acid transport system permease protein
MNSKFPWKSTLILTVVGLVLVFLPGLLITAGLVDAYTAHILAMAGVNALMAVSVNVITGITGQLSLGQAGFLAIGGYACIVFNMNMHLPMVAAVICASLFTAFIGFLIGFPVLKLTGDYLAIVTLGFGEIIRVIAINLKPLTGGANGHAFTTVVTLNPTIAFWVVTAILVLLIALLQNFLRSSYGRAILARREDEIAANSSGVPIFRYKMLGFVIAAFIAGLAGCLFAMVVGFVKPTDASWTQSINYLIFVVLGGMGSMTGSILSAYVLTFLQEELRFLQDYRMVIYPLILILVMIFRPQGLLGTKELSFVKCFDWLKQKLNGKAAKKAEAKA